MQVSTWPHMPNHQSLHPYYYRPAKCWRCRHTAHQLLKLETIMNVVNLGYSALWVEPHALLARKGRCSLLSAGPVGAVWCSC